MLSAKTACHLACDGVSDDRAALSACLAPGGPACGKAVAFGAGCTLLLSSPGSDAAAATVACSGTKLLGFGATISLARRACRGGPTAGASCASDGQCGDGGRCACDLATAGQETCEFAPSGDATYTVLTTAREASNVEISGFRWNVNQISAYGTCGSGDKAGFPCSAVCGDGPYTNAACDADSDCVGGTQCSGGTSGCCNGTALCGDPGACTGESAPPSGAGRITLIDAHDSAGALLRDNLVFDHKYGEPQIAVGRAAVVQHNVLDLRSASVIHAGLGNDWTATPSLSGIHQVGSANGGEISDNVITASRPGPEGYGIKADGTTQIGGNVVAADIVAATNTSFPLALIQISGQSLVHHNVVAARKGSHGVYMMGFGGVVDGNILTNWSPDGWGTAVVAGGDRSQQLTINNNYLSGGGCLGVLAGSINVTATGNRCIGPGGFGFIYTTGSIYTGNYIAWLPRRTSVPLWLGASPTALTQSCTEAGVPFGCCKGAAAGDCDSAWATGSVHGTVSGNLLQIHSLVTGGSVVKAGGGAGSVLTNVSFVGNTLLHPNGLCLDFSFDDASFGGAPNPESNESGDAPFQASVFVGNVLACATGVAFPRNPPEQNRIANLVFSANGQATNHDARFRDWRWSYGRKDDDPLTVLFGSTASAVGESASFAALVSSTGPEKPAARAKGTPFPEGTAVRATCELDTAPDHGRGEQSRTFTLLRNGAATAMSCTCSEQSKSCTTASEVAFAAGDAAVWQLTSRGKPTPARASCALLFATTGLGS